jgi:hypothetical protein
VCPVDRADISARGRHGLPASLRGRKDGWSRWVGDDDNDDDDDDDCFF